MIKSMTGFGKTVVSTPENNMTIEIRALNSKQLDIFNRLPALFKEKENEIRILITNELERGKIDITITAEHKDDAVVQGITIDKALAKSYYKTYVSLSEELGNPLPSDIFIQVLQAPEVICAPKEELNELTWETLRQGLFDCCNKVNQFRLSEGNYLAKDFERRIHLIRETVAQVQPFEEERIKALKERFVKMLEQHVSIAQYDTCRLEQELIYYIEKIDITEEKIRLIKHCQYFLDTMTESESQGKKLGFIAQELGREINTLGAKACDFNIQQLVVCMKDEIEKIKEQLANVL